MGTLSTETNDVLIIGAGLSGLSCLYNIRNRFPSWKVRVLESGPSVGGTWYWNCYPGARFGSESVSYQLTWDKELLQEWDWREAFAAQAETLKYIERFSDKNDLRGDIQFNTTIISARWQDSQAFHTSRFPKDLDLSRDLQGKRIGVIGTGATGIQTVTSLSKEPSIKSISIFQRTATWAAPLRNYEIPPKEMKGYKADYNAVFQRCVSTPTGFLCKPDPRKTLEVTHEERLELWEKLYNEPGFGKWQEFAPESKIQCWLRNYLVPKDHGFGTRRIPLESRYYEAFNQPNVHLVDLKETPITSVTKSGIVTSDGKEHELDVLIFATGFDAITGSFARIDWTSKSGRPLLGISSTKEGRQALWVNHTPCTSLGIMTNDMPNMFMILGPHQPFGTVPRSIEHAVEVVMGFLEYCREHDFTYVEPTRKACDEWTEHVIKCSEGALENEVDSWLTGVNTNVEGKTVRMVARYCGSVVEYRRRCEECRVNGFPGFVFV
ncbi:hypothetical protein AAE478_009759 [Parahypoxylon ruwenzoriense]